jgi:hypothetical protein
LHIDQPDFCQQEPFMKRLRRGATSLVPMHGDKENRGSADTLAVTNELLDQRVQQQVNARTNALTSPFVNEPSQVSMKRLTEL